MVPERRELEEATWFIAINDSYPNPARLTARYRKRSTAYLGTGIMAKNGA